MKNEITTTPPTNLQKIKDLYIVVIDPGLIVFQTDICLTLAIFAFISFFPSRKNGSDASN